MRTKSKYREIQSENIPVEKELPPVAVIAPEAVAVAVDSEPQAEVDASLALQQQLEELKKSEEMQRQRQAQIPLQQQPMTREQKLELWKRQGLTEAEMNFLRQNPQMIDYPQLTSQAAAEAMQQGHQRESQAFQEAMKMNFDNHLDRMRAQATPAATETTPAFFQAPPPPPPRSRSHFVSAPVSREIPSGRPREENPRQMTLSAEETFIAKASGISATEYAKNKIRLQREKAAGDRQ
jgi:hypothetical protein